MCVAIRNDQYLFREGPGRGEISPQDPLETRLYDVNGNIYDKDNPFEVRVRKLEEILGLAEENPEQYTLAARLKRIEDMLESGSAKVTLSGSKARISSEPVVGVRTVTSIATELHAGTSRKVGRTLLMVRNLDPAVRVRVGPSTVSDRTGFGIEPEAVLTLAIDPGSDVPIYAVSEAGAVQVEVLEA